MAMHFPDIDRRSLWEAHGKRCAYCGEPLEFRALCIDHIVPQTLERSGEVDQLLERLGLPKSFNFHGELNLLPSCHRCNMAKSAKLFELPRLALLLEGAKSKSKKVAELKSKYEAEDHAAEARIALSLALGRGAASFDQAAEWLADIGREHGRYSLNHEIRLADGTNLKAIRKDEISRLLDAPIVPEPGLELLDDHDSSVSVRTCREYQKARSDGFYPYTTYAIKAASAFQIPLAVFGAIQRSAVPERSFIREPYVGVADLHLMPLALAPGVSWGPGGEDAVEFQGATNLQDLVDAGRMRIRRVRNGSLELEDDGAGALFMELIRSDITGDGNEDILIAVYDYATQGTFGAGRTGVLSRTSAEAMFTWDETLLSSNSPV